MVYFHVWVPLVSFHLCPHVICFTKCHSFFENSATLLSPTSTHHTQQAEGIAFSPHSSSSFSIFLSCWHLLRVKMQSLFQGLVSKSSHIKYWRLGLQHNGFWANTIQPITVSTHLSLQATAVASLYLCTIFTMSFFKKTAFLCLTLLLLAPTV